MSTLLLITAGHTDVQLVVDGFRREVKRSLRKAFHDRLLDGLYTLVDTPPKAPKDRRSNDEVDALPDGVLTVCTPKLDAVLERFGSNPPDKAVIFDTQRAGGDDPRGASVVMEARLAKDKINAECFAYLEGDERLEDPSSDLDAIVRQEVVNRIAGKISSEIEKVDPKRIVLVTTGGLRAANAVIRELVRLHAVGRADVESLEVPDGAFAGQADRAVPERLHPATGFRARWQALSLIKEGHLLGAWDVASHLDGKPGQEWTQVVNWLARFAAARDLEDCPIGVLRHPRKAVHAALRVELALRAEDVPRAIQGTVAFLEAAAEDHLLKYFEPVRECSPQKGKRYRLRPGALEPSGEKLLRDDNKDNEDNRNRPFEAEMQDKGEKWFQFHQDGIGRFARDYVKSGPLKKLSDVTNGIKYLRNNVAHGEPAEHLVESAREEMQGAGLWSPTDPSSGRVTFLTQKLVQDVLVELGVPNPGRLLEDLLDEVRKCLLTTTS